MENQNQLIKILISGEGGQGIQTIAKIFANACYCQQYEVCYMPHYGVEMRMGISLAYLQIGVKPIYYPKFTYADILVSMTPRDLEFIKSFSTHGTKIINGMNLDQYMKENNIRTKSLNMIILGLIVRKFKDKLPLETQKVREEIKILLGKKEGLAQNIEAFTKGLNLEEKYYHNSLDKFPRRNLQPCSVKCKLGEYYHWPSHCKGCGLCIEKCPVKALSWSKTEINYFGQPVPEVNSEKCLACGICEQLCPDMAIRVVKKK